MITESVAGFLVLVSAIAGQPGESYVERIDTLTELQRFSKASSLPPATRFTKYIVPARDGDPTLLPALFQNVNIHEFHIDFLQQDFPKRFPALSLPEYDSLVNIRATRDYLVGVVFQFSPEQYGFNIFTLPGSAAELLRPEEARRVLEVLRGSFTAGSIVYTPRERAAVENAKSWGEVDFDVEFPFSGSDADYIPYTRAANFGRVRIFTAEAFEEANNEGGFGSQDILVLEERPRDVDTVVAGAITAVEQGEVDHLAIRMARRGTPNAFVKNALKEFAPFEGKLVRLEVATAGYTVDPDVTLEEAEAWWAEHRPNIGDIAEADAEYSSLDAVDAIDVENPSVPLVTRYGGKASNFARLYQIVDEPQRVPGFVVPFHYYVTFMNENTTPSRVDPTKTITFGEYIDELLSDPAFQSDSKVRFEELDNLRDMIRDDGVVNPETVQAITEKLVEVFPDTTRTVRFRSSSNAEDLLEFNGAGLYRSTSVCIADELDEDEDGPSLCNLGIDPEPRANERGVARALKRVWRSLWNFRAHEEREYFQIRHEQARMAVLVSEGFPDEQSNGVAFTGSPDIVTDKRFLINVQEGDTPVVFPDPGVLPEKVLLELENGTVSKVIRARRSTLTPDKDLLSDDQLHQLGAAMASVEARLPVNLGKHAPEKVVLDFEFKFDRFGALRFKQVRPFLIATPTTTDSPEEFRGVVPEGFILTTGFNERQDPIDILRKKLRVRLRAGEHVLSTDGTSTADIFEWIQLSPDGPRIPPRGPGVWSAQLEERPLSGGDGYNFNTVAQFDVDGRPPLFLRFDTMFFLNEGPRTIDLDPEALTYRVNPYLAFLTVEFDPSPFGFSPLLPDNLDHLPEYTIDVEFDTGDRAHFVERFQILEEGTGPAELQSAEVTLGGETRVIDDYWHLAYTAGHHNDQPPPDHWAVFEPPIDYEGVLVHALSVSQGFEEEGPTAKLLDENFEEITELGVDSFTRLREGVNQLEFLRGDVDFSGAITVSDVVKILRQTFLAGAPLPCPDAADVDDFGDINVTDAILLILYLFVDDDPPVFPGPEDGCGLDPEPDGLGICFGLGCLWDK